MAERSLAAAMDWRLYGATTTFRIETTLDAIRSNTGAEGGARAMDMDNGLCSETAMDVEELPESDADAIGRFCFVPHCHVLRSPKLFARDTRIVAAGIITVAARRAIADKRRLGDIMSIATQHLFGDLSGEYDAVVVAGVDEVTEALMEAIGVVQCAHNEETRDCINSGAKTINTINVAMVNTVNTKRKREDDDPAMRE